ncbi:MAG: hypothetical protein WDN31_09705 [Hyphomicrobium sp.]
MKAKVAALVLGAAAAAVLLAPVAGFVSPAEASKCVTKRGKGYAWTEDMAKFQAWEIVAQLSGNWPHPERHLPQRALQVQQGRQRLHLPVVDRRLQVLICPLPVLPPPGRPGDPLRNSLAAAFPLPADPRRINVIRRCRSERDPQTTRVSPVST